MYTGKTNLDSQAVPTECFDIYDRAVPIFMDSFSDAVAYRLRTMTLEDLSNISGVSEGIENRILKTVGGPYKITDICAELKTKRYTYTRLMRIICHILLGITKEHEEMFSPDSFEPYIRVLGFRKSAEPLVGALSRNSSVPVIMNVNKDEKLLSESQRLMLDIEKRATDIYYLGYPTPSAKKRALDYTMPVVIENL
ncbi:MAG: nucleotidyltransferase family protein [Clostridiales bacterium]|nr:nucleotidyltransferase family protein [Clostridiales bacterium]